MRHVNALAILLATTLGSSAGAQQYFGQNHVQFDKFD